MAEQQKCARCGVADAEVGKFKDRNGEYPELLGQYLHLYATGTPSFNKCIAALRRENERLRAREARVAVGFAKWRIERGLVGMDNMADDFAAFLQSDAGKAAMGE